MAGGRGGGEPFLVKVKMAGRKKDILGIIRMASRRGCETLFGKIRMTVRRGG